MILNLYLTSEVKRGAKVLFYAGCAFNEIIMILIQVKDCESLTVISVEFYCKVNPVCFTCF